MSTDVFMSSLAIRAMVHHGHGTPVGLGSTKNGGTLGGFGCARGPQTLGIDGSVSALFHVPHSYRRIHKLSLSRRKLRDRLPARNSNSSKQVADKKMAESLSVFDKAWMGKDRIASDNAFKS